jgi:DNA-binding MarR family transcriptional regulator
LLTRELRETDQRKICLELTVKGKQALDESYMHPHDYFADKFARLPDNDRDQIDLMIDKLKTLFDLDTQISAPEPGLVSQNTSQKIGS